MARGEFKFEVENFKGESKEYNMIPVCGKDGLRIHFEISKELVASLAGVSTGDVAGLANAVQSLDFDKLWGIAEILFKSCMVDGYEVKNLQDFAKTSWNLNPEEFYMAMYHAIMGNYPDFFSSIKEKLEGIIPNITGMVPK